MALAQIEDPAIVGQAVASQLGVPDTPGQDPVEAIAKHLADHRLLVVLDNCEHLAEAVAGLAEYLLGACPALVVLATSREALGVEGELSWQVPSLSLPPEARPGPAMPAPSTAPTAASLVASDAVRLFEQRAQLVRPSFRVTDENAAAVLAICQRLDGLPLAIELAAARMRIMSSIQLAERMDDIFAVLVGGARSAPPRHQALRATLDWSYDLLEADERAIFRRLAVFSGGFTLQAAERIAASGDIRPERDAGTADAAGGQVAAAGGTHPRQLPLLAAGHHPGLRRGTGWPRRASATRRGALTWSTSPSSCRTPPRGSSRSSRSAGARLDRLDAELPNLRRAFEFAQETGDPVAPLRIAGPLDRYAYLRGRYHEVRQWMDAAVTSAPGRARRAAGPGAARRRQARACCSATTRPRCAG